MTAVYFFANKIKLKLYYEEKKRKEKSTKRKKNKEKEKKNFKINLEISNGHDDSYILLPWRYLHVYMYVVVVFVRHSIYNLFVWLLLLLKQRSWLLSKHSRGMNYFFKYSDNFALNQTKRSIALCKHYVMNGDEVNQYSCFNKNRLNTLWLSLCLFV